MSNCRGEKTSDIVPSISMAGAVSGNTFSPARVRFTTLISSSVPWSLYHRLSAAPILALCKTSGSTSEVATTILICGKPFDALCGGKTGMLMMRLHIHKDELYGGVAVLFRFKGVTENADKMKLAVCRKTIDKVLLDV